MNRTVAHRLEPGRVVRLGPALVLGLLTLGAGCRTASPQATAGQGGAQFRSVAVHAPSVPVEALYAICWPADAPASARVDLLFGEGDSLPFEAKDGATNTTARCLREIASAFPFVARPTGTVTLAPPAAPASGWDVLAWVGLLSPSRYGPERGLVDPGPLAAACTSLGLGLRPATRCHVGQGPGGGVLVAGGAISEAERCLEAVLGSTAWPSARAFALDFSSTRRGSPPPSGEVAFYFAPDTSTGQPLDPARVKEALSLVQGQVGACWEAALTRRAGLGGARTFRFTVQAGRVVKAWVASTLALGGETAADYLLDQCLAGALQTAHFEGQTGDGLYTWLFATRG